MTLSASVEALGQLTQGVQAMISTAVLAGSMAATGGSASFASPNKPGMISGGSGSDGSGATGAFMGGASSSGGGTGLGGGEAILEHYNQAEALAQQAGTFSALGLRAPAQYARTQAHGHELAARKQELERRLARFSGVGSGSTNVRDATSALRAEVEKVPDFGFSHTVNRGVATTFTNTVTGFQEGFSGLSKHIERAGFDPQVVAERYPEDTGRMVAAYLAQPDQIDRAENPLMEATILGGADGFRTDIFGSSDLP